MGISFEEAVESVLSLARAPEERNVLLPDAAGEVLSRDVVADRNIPPSIGPPWMDMPSAGPGMKVASPFGWLGR